jgi:hypothetical protein
METWERCKRTFWSTMKLEGRRKDVSSKELVPASKGVSGGLKKRI